MITLDNEKSFKELSNLLSYSKKNNVPVACLIKKNTFTKNKKYFVEKINIYGNNVTREQVLRDQFIVDEGDAFNKILHNKSINTLKSLNIFKSVSMSPEGSKDLPIVIVLVL